MPARIWRHRRRQIRSGGRALLTDPRLLILAEPTEGIQPSIIEQIGDTLRRLRQEGLEPDPRHEIRHALPELKREGRLAILLVEQFVDFCRECADRFYAMDRAIVAAGTVGSSRMRWRDATCRSKSFALCI